MLQLGLFHEPAGGPGRREPAEAPVPASPVAPVAHGSTSHAVGAPAAGVPAVMFVRHPRARRYLIRVRADGTVRVTIPRRGSRREAVQFYEQQAEWIATQRQRVERLRARMPPDLPPAEERRLRAEAQRVLPARCLELAAQTGLVVQRVSVRNQKHRWGSCSTSGLICLNWRLVTMPDWVRDYVIYHELMHLKQMNHSPAFWRLVRDVCPRFREARQWLRRHAHAPHAAPSDRPGLAPDAAVAADA